MASLARMGGGSEEMMPKRANGCADFSIGTTCGMVSRFDRVGR